MNLTNGAICHLLFLSLVMLYLVLERSGSYRQSCLGFCRQAGKGAESFLYVAVFGRNLVVLCASNLL